ncbi:MAG: NAD(P)-dependent oxidoreductase [Oscillospiraceae bacterium]|jgi:glutamate synthase (NADPH/NADH) small chain
MIVRKPDMTPTKTPMALLPVEKRFASNDEVKLGYTKEQAIAEAQRCMNCPERYCEEHCPAHTAISDFIDQIRKGDFERAWDIIAATNPMAGITSRVCPCEQQCESHCTRGIKSEPVAIGSLERFVCDWHGSKDNNGQSAALPPVGKKVAVIGSGPAGLACAITLARAEVNVTVYEKDDRIGGVLAWGIPSFVLPEHHLENLINELKSWRVEFKNNTELDKDFTLDDVRSQYDAVFLGVGAGKVTGIPFPVDGKVEGVMQADDYLAALEKPQADTVTVFGGGGTAIDAARVALRSGAKRVQLVYRRTEVEIPATRDEIALAKEEGVEFVTLTSPKRIVAEAGRITGVECDCMGLSSPEYPGGRRTVVPSGKTVVLKSDLALFALGFEIEPVDGVASDSLNRITVDDQYRTSIDGVYAGGDVVTGPSTVVKAVAAGRDAARAILERFSRELG